MATSKVEKPFVDRFTTPGAVKPGKRCKDTFSHADTSHPAGKRVFERPTTGLVSIGGGANGSPSPKSTQRPIYKPHVKQTHPAQIEAGLVVGSPARMQASVERQRDTDGSPKGKKQNVEVLPGHPSPKHVSSFMSDTESSARRKAKVAAERVAFPAKARQPNPWEKPGLNPTAAINMHAGHGVSMNAILHDSDDTQIDRSEIDRLKSTGAAGKSGTCIPDYEDLPHPGKRTGSPENGAGIDHVAAQIFERPAPGAPAVPQLELTKLGKRTTITKEKKSPQWSHRNDSSAMGPRKRMHPKMTARRLGGTWMSGQPSARKPFSRVIINSARGKANNMLFGTKASVKNAEEQRPTTATTGNAAAGTKMTKRFLIEHRCTSADNTFARANHKAARLEDGSASFSASPSRSNFGSGSLATIESSPAASSPVKGGSVGSLGGSGGEAAIGSGSTRSIENPRPCKKFLAQQKPNSSLQGCFGVMPPTKKALEFRGVVSPFGDHSNQSPTKNASPARIGWKNEQ